MAAKKTAKKATEPVAKKTAKKSTAAAAKKAAKKAPARKVAAKKTVETQTAPKAPKEKKTIHYPSPDVLARAAYLNYRRRVEQGLPGDAHGDWLEAERQLLEI